MLPKEALTIITVIIFLIPVVVFVPTMIGESQKDMQEDTTIMVENDTETLGQYLEITVNQVNPSSADVTVTDTDNGESQTQTIQENETVTYAYENGNISVTLTDIHTDIRVVLDTEYPSEYGWNAQESRVSYFMPMVILIPMAIVLIMILLGIIRGDE